MRRLIALAAPLAAHAGCADGELDCGLTSTITDYEPACVGVVVIYPEETRLFIDDSVVGYLPPAVEAEVLYGGTSGNSLTLVYADEEVGDNRLSTVTFGEALADVYLRGVFESGEISGRISLTVLQGDGIEIEDSN